MPTAEEVIQRLGLIPHPNEGGFYAETYRAEESVAADNLPTRYTSKRDFGTAIYYLLTPTTYSEIHRLATDEIFHFYLGDPVTQVHLYPDGSTKSFELGTDLLAGQIPQLVVPRGVWQGSFLNEGGEFALMGATVSPGFEFEDYESGDREKLLDEYPGAAEEIGRLTQDS